jgi:hypothetical protein
LAHGAAVDLLGVARLRAQQIGGSRGSLEPPGPLLTHPVYTAHSERLPTRLNPLAERTCFSQARPVAAGSAEDAATALWALCSLDLHGQGAGYGAHYGEASLALSHPREAASARRRGLDTMCLDLSGSRT